MGELTKVALFLAIAVFAYYTYRLRELAKGDITEEGWAEIRQIIYRAIDSAISLGRAANLGTEVIINEAVMITYREIQSFNLPEEDKNFWTQERLRNFIAPVIKALIDAVEK